MLKLLRIDKIIIKQASDQIFIISQTDAHQNHKGINTY